MKQCDPSNDILVSVLCITYNHEDFIADCLDGILMQETDFKYEIIVHDDASTDRTRLIIEKYYKQHPSVITPIFQNENQFKNIGGQIVLTAFSKAKGRIIAYCEGDDRWTDKAKLQHQVEYLTANPDCAGCFHRTRLINARGTVVAQEYFLPTQDKYSLADCILKLSSPYSTCSLVFKRVALEAVPIWLRNNLTDMFLEFQIARYGNMGFVDRNMADYRSHRGGVWTSRSDVSQIVELAHRYKTLLESTQFSTEFRSELQTRLDYHLAQLCTRTSYNRLLRRSRLRLAVGATLRAIYRLFNRTLGGRSA